MLSQKLKMKLWRKRDIWESCRISLRALFAAASENGKPPAGTAGGFSQTGKIL